MLPNLSRRNLLKLASSSLALPSLLGPLGTSASPSSTRPAPPTPAPTPAPASFPVSDLFPSHPPELVREVVTVAHFNLKRLQELVDARPALARAAHDWGFGDWEDALGAASHMGNRPIAEYLISKGARPSLFSATMLGQLDVVKSFIAAQPGSQAIRGPHSISLLAHARVGGEVARPVYDFLQPLPGADMDQPVALSPADSDKLVGTYPFGIGTSQQVDVDADVKMYAASKMYSHAPQLNFTRKGAMPRPLFHLGNWEFFPAGAPSARVRFTEDAQGVTMTVTDADLILSTRRTPATK
jgi:hypothetical protein